MRSPHGLRAALSRLPNAWPPATRIVLRLRRDSSEPPCVTLTIQSTAHTVTTVSTSKKSQRLNHK